MPMPSSVYNVPRSFDMKVYKHGSREVVGKHWLLVQPGSEIPDVPGWFDGEGRPVLIPVLFQNGMAEVADHLARYLLDKGYVHKSPLVIPKASKEAKNTEDEKA